jgi:hypothetical protein
MRDLAALIDGACATVPLLSVTNGTAGTHTGEVIANVHAAAFVGIHLVCTAPVAGAGSLQVNYECNLLDATPSGFAEFANFNPLAAGDPKPARQLYQSSSTQFSLGLINPDDPIGTPGDQIGVGADNYFPVGFGRVVAVITGAESWTFQVVGLFAG